MSILRKIIGILILVIFLVVAFIIGKLVWTVMLPTIFLYLPHSYWIELNKIVLYFILGLPFGVFTPFGFGILGVYLGRVVYNGTSTSGKSAGFGSASEGSNPSAPNKSGHELLKHFRR